jgi:MFS family permease
MLPTQLPYLIINKFHGEPQTVGFVIATSMIFNALIAKQYAKIKARLSYFQIYSLTFLVFSIATFLISHAQTIYELFYSTIFLGSAFGLLLVNTNAWFLSQVTVSKRGKASGVLTSSFFLGQFSSPLMVQPIVQLYGIQKLFLFVSFLSMLISLGLFFWFSTSGRKKKS